MGRKRSTGVIPIIEGTCEPRKRFCGQKIVGELADRFPGMAQTTRHEGGDDDRGKKRGNFFRPGQQSPRRARKPEGWGRQGVKGAGTIS